MPRILFYEPAYRRIAGRIADLPGIEPALMQKDGRILLDGKEVTPEDVDVEIGWANSDLFAGPVREYMVALLKTPKLRWLQSGAAGFDNPVFAQIVSRGTRLTTSHVQAVGMAEYTLATVLEDDELTSIFAAQLLEGDTVCSFIIVEVCFVGP